MDLSVTVANTHERQEALAKATTHGKKFYVTGGVHITSDNMFIAAEMGNRKREIAEMEKDKKVRVDFHTRRDAALIILDRLDHELDGNVARLTNKELEVKKTSPNDVFLKVVVTIFKRQKLTLS